MRLLFALVLSIGISSVSFAQEAAPASEQSSSDVHVTTRVNHSESERRKADLVQATSESSPVQLQSSDQLFEEVANKYRPNGAPDKLEKPSQSQVNIDEALKAATRAVDEIAALPVQPHSATNEIIANGATATQNDSGSSKPAQGAYSSADYAAARAVLDDNRGFSFFPIDSNYEAPPATYRVHNSRDTRFLAARLEDHIQGLDTVHTYEDAEKQLLNNNSIFKGQEMVRMIDLLRDKPFSSQFEASDHIILNPKWSDQENLMMANLIRNYLDAQKADDTKNRSLDLQMMQAAFKSFQASDSPEKALAVANRVLGDIYASAHGRPRAYVNTNSSSSAAPVLPVAPVVKTSEDNNDYQIARPDGAVAN